MALSWPRGLMDMASDFESGSCGFESHRGQNFFYLFFILFLALTFKILNILLYAMAAYKFQEMQVCEKNESETNAKKDENFDNLAFESKENEAKRNESEPADF